LHVLGKEVHSSRTSAMPEGPNRTRLEHVRTKKPAIAVGMCSLFSYLVCSPL
jgi:hypothetical protein